MLSWFHYLDKCVLLEIQLRFQENVLLCIYVFELVVRLKRLGRDFFSCESPDLEPWLFLSFNGLHVRLPNALGRDIWGLHDQRVRKGRQCLSSCTLKSPPQALFLNLKSRITLHWDLLNKLIFLCDSSLKVSPSETAIGQHPSFVVKFWGVELIGFGYCRQQCWRFLVDATGKRVQKITARASGLVGFWNLWPRANMWRIFLEKWLNNRTE